MRRSNDSEEITSSTDRSEEEAENENVGREGANKKAALKSVFSSGKSYINKN